MDDFYDEISGKLLFFALLKVIALCLTDFEWQLRRVLEMVILDYCLGVGGELWLVVVGGVLKSGIAHGDF